MKTFFKKAAVMTLAVMASAVVLDVPPAVNAEAASAEEACDVDHSTATQWTGGDFTPGNSYYLDIDVPLPNEIEITGEVTLCLNGHTITAAPDSRIFTIKNGGELTLCDCKETGEITGGAPPDGIGSDDKPVPSRGGAVYVYNGGAFTMNSGNISVNKAKEGAGVYNSGTFIMNGGTISDNEAVQQGGGIYVWGSSSDSAEFTMNGGTISGNKVKNVEDEPGSYGGGGVYTAGEFTMNSGSEIFGNTADFCYGGGVCVSNYGKFTMNDGTISRNKSTSCYAGGVYVSGGTFIMEDGIITENEADKDGGGVCLGDNTKATVFTMKKGTISDNKAKNGAGIDVVSGTVNMMGGTITENKADSGHGGGVHVNGGMFNMTDGEIVENNAVKGGGGVCLNKGTLLLDGDVTIKSNEMADGLSSNVYLIKDKKDNTITIGNNFDTAEKIGVHASISPNCKDFVNAAEFAENVAPKDLIGYFKADVDKGVIYNETESKLKLFGPHNAAKTEEVPPTCLEDGSEEHWDCSVCEKMFEDEECTTELENVTVIPATGHNYGDWITISEPTLTTPGLAERICANDPAHREPKTIPMLSGNTGSNNSSVSSGNSGNTNSDVNNSGSTDSSVSSGNTDSSDSSAGGNAVNSGDSGYVSDNPATGIAVSLVPLAVGIVAFMVTVKRNKK